MSPETKRCSKCKEEKSIDLFRFMKKGRQSRQNYCKDCQKEHISSRFKENKENNLCLRCGGARDGRYKCCSQCRDYIKRYYTKNSSKGREASRSYIFRLKLEVFHEYGGPICKCCGEIGLTFLSLDHVYNDGAAHRKEIKSHSIYRWLKRHGYPDKDRYQVLCMNCNFSKRLNDGTCEHQFD